MPRVVHPMLATLVDRPFDDQNWLFEVKWDGYRAVAFIQDGKVRLVSRNQNDLTRTYPELGDLSTYIRVRSAVLDGEIVALDEQGRASFSLMQQRTGISHNGRKVKRNTDIPVLYYVFDLLWVDGYDLTRVDLDKRKDVLAGLIATSGILRYSEHFDGTGVALYEAAKQRGLEGIVAKRRNSCYIQKRSREWLKMKVTQTQECVIGGYTDPRGGREHFGSIILGLYDNQGRLIHVGQAGSGFTEETHDDMWQRLKKIETTKKPFFGPVESNRRTHWIEPKMVAEIKFTEWTHESEDGGIKMRAPVYLGLRADKDPRECVLERPLSSTEYRVASSESTGS
ncbi:MAG TPA: non-homologous end-joining DNA ligase [Terriglobales bacterium]|nr:non-homologous end-joining DNA ligase [Terriglobales bacterium]